MGRGVGRRGAVATVSAAAAGDVRHPSFQGRVGGGEGADSEEELCSWKQGALRVLSLYSWGRRVRPIGDRTSW